MSRRDRYCDLRSRRDPLSEAAGVDHVTSGPAVTHQPH